VKRCGVRELAVQARQREPVHLLGGVVVTVGTGALEGGSSIGNHDRGEAEDDEGIDPPIAEVRLERELLRRERMVAAGRPAFSSSGPLRQATT
jgi:hypothetical protein